MKDFQLSKHNLDTLFEEFSEELESAPVIVVSSQDASTGKWGMARLWRRWMNTTAVWMTRNGATMPLCFDKYGKPYGKRAFNKNDAHEMFTAQWMLVDADGTRLSWAKKSHDGMRAATKGERFLAMWKHEQYAIDRGILLFKPKGSEYSKLEEEQSK